jgi:hypothetical protein
MFSMKNHVRDALLTVALFGSVGAAFAQTPPSNAGDVQSAQSPKVPGHDGVEEPAAKASPAPATSSAVFVNGTLNVPNAPKDTATTPSKFSAANAKGDEIPTMAHGPALTDAQRKLILEQVKSAGALSVPYAGPTTQLPATTRTQAWPADLLRQVPSLADTTYVALPGKVLLVRPDTSIVVGEIDR